MNTYTDQWWSDIFIGVEQAACAQELLRFATQASAKLGFTCCSYGSRIPVTAAEPVVTVLASYPEAWVDRYLQANYVRVDPTVELGLRRSCPILWTDGLFAASRQLWSDAQEHGLRVGIAQSSWESHGAYGLFSMARDREPITASELRSLSPRLRWLADNLHRRMQYFVSREVLEEHAPRLSVRERDVLRWTADGKTSWEVGKILSISQSTVNFHINNIVTKLRVQNKIQAAAKACALGLLDTQLNTSEEPGTRATRVLSPVTRVRRG